MNVAQMSKRKLRATLARLFGSDVRWSVEGNYCFVHLDGASAQERQLRARSFAPTLFFDPSCPCCRPFLEEGAFMVYADKELMGVRMLNNHQLEMVVLREPSSVT